MSTGGGPLLGGGGFFGRYGDYGPGGPYGAYPGCGCASLMILGGVLLICGGVFTFFENILRGIGF